MSSYICILMFCFPDAFITVLSFDSYILPFAGKRNVNIAIALLMKFRRALNLPFISYLFHDNLGSKGFVCTTLFN